MNLPFSQESSGAPVFIWWNREPLQPLDASSFWTRVSSASKPTLGPGSLCSGPGWRWFKVSCLAWLGCCLFSWALGSLRSIFSMRLGKWPVFLKQSRWFDIFLLESRWQLYLMAYRVRARKALWNRADDAFYCLQMCLPEGRNLQTRKWCWFLTYQVSWRKIILGCAVAICVLDAIPQFLTIFDIFRDPYFYLGEPIVKEIPLAMMNLVTNLIANEVADENNCAMTAGMLKSISQIGNPLAVLLSNQLFGSFHPSLTERSNYIEDQPAFRVTVAESYLVSYGLSLLCLAFLPLLPYQKQDAQRRKRDWPYRPSYAILASVVLTVTFIYAFIGAVLILDENLACSRFLGGKGCKWKKKQLV